VTIYEVNEAVLSRKYIAQSEQLTQEQTARAALEADFIEMESALKKRILYLEQYKLAAAARIGHLQSRVDSSVASSDYLALQAEIDVLREDHLNTLRREVEARMSALSALDTNRELRSARIIIAGLQADLSAATAGMCFFMVYVYARNCQLSLWTTFVHVLLANCTNIHANHTSPCIFLST